MIKLANELEVLVDRTQRKPGSGESILKQPEVGAENGFSSNKSLNKPVRLNVGGSVFPTTWRTMSTVQGTRLARMADSKTLDEALGKWHKKKFF